MSIFEDLECTGEKILIVDDNPANLAVAVEHLEQHGFEVAIAQDGEEALARAAFIRPSLILLDVDMPGIDGYETCRRLKDTPATWTTPVIFMTALGDTRDKMAAFAVGGVDCIAKPFQVEELLARVRTHIRLRSHISSLYQEVETLTEQATAEQAVRERQSRFLAITASLYEAVLLVSGRGEIQFANLSAQNLLGAAAQAPAMLDEVMQLIAEDQPLAFADSALYPVLETGRPLIDDDIFIVTAGQTRINVAIAVSRLGDDGGEPAVVLSLRPIGDLKEAQRQAHQAARLASVGQLAAGIAHEINTPIQYVGDNLHFIIDSFKEVKEAVAKLRTQLLAGPVTVNGAVLNVKALFEEADLPGLLDEIPLAAAESLDGIRHVAHIVKSMRDFAHPGSSEKVLTNLNDCVDRTVTISRNHWRDVAAIETVLAPDLPDLLCYPSDVNQLLLNLIVNAAQAIGEAKTGRPGVIHVETGRDGDWLELTVRDNGPGIPPAIRDKIFDPFFTTKDVGKGTGQGLSISRDAVVKKHGGTITVDPNYLEGARFVIRLPLTPASPD